MSIRAGKKLRSQVYLSDPIGVDREGNQIALMDILDLPGNSVLDEVETRIQAQKMIGVIGSVLSQRERTVIEGRYGLYGGALLTQNEIARMLGISRSYVSRIEKKAVEKLRIALEKKAK